MPQVIKSREEVLKYILSTDWSTGGYLPEAKASKFITSIGQYSSLLNMIRRVPLKTMDRNKIPKLYFSGPITRGSTERTHNPSTSKPVTTELTIQAHKLESRTEMSIDSLLTNIEFAGFEDTYMTGCVQQVAEDHENVCLNGDDSITGTSDLDLLLKTFDGFDVQSESAHILDAGGYPIQKDIFAAAVKRMPKRWRKKTVTKLKFFVSDDVWMDWVTLNSGRADAIGQKALAGEAIAPFGYPLVPVPLFPDDIEISTAVATAARVRADKEAYIKIETGVNDKFTMNVDGGGAVAVTIAAGVYIPQTIKAELNTKFAVSYFDVDAFGRLIIESTTTGGASSIVIVPVANDAYDTLGFVAGTTTGAAAGAGKSADGSFMWLTDPLNLIYGVFDKVRFNRRYDDETDAIKAVWFMYIGAAIQEVDMMIKVKNIRGRKNFG